MPLDDEKLVANIISKFIGLHLKRKPTLSPAAGGCINDCNKVDIGERRFSL